MTSDDEIHDALLAALRSPARADELAGEDAAVAAMLGALQTTAPARRGSRSRRGAAVAVVTMASLGVGGLVAAGPGFFGDVRDTLHDTFVPGGDDEPDDGTVPTPGTTGTTGSQPGGTTAVPGNGTGTAPDATDPEGDGSVVPGTTGDGDDDGPGNGNGTPPTSNPGNGNGNGNGNPNPGEPPTSQPGNGNANGGGVGNRPTDPGPPTSNPGNAGGNGTGNNTGDGNNGGGNNTGGSGNAPADPGPPTSNPGNAGDHGKPNG